MEDQDYESVVSALKLLYDHAPIHLRDACIYMLEREGFGVYSSAPYVEECTRKFIEICKVTGAIPPSTPIRMYGRTPHNLER